MRLAKLNRNDLEFVATRMREWDRREVFATRWDDDPEQLSSDIMAGGDFGFVAGIEDPIAAFGAIPVWNNVWEVWMFATDDWPRVALGVTRFIKRTMIPSIKEAGYHRAQCRSMEGHDVAHRWLESLGAYKESDLKNYGRDGQLFHLYCWTRPESSTESHQK